MIVLVYFTEQVLDNLGHRIVTSVIYGDKSFWYHTILLDMLIKGGFTLSFLNYWTIIQVTMINNQKCNSKQMTA